MADETKIDEEVTTVLPIRDQDLLALGDVSRSREGHHAAPVVPAILRVAPRLASVVEVRRDGEDAFGAGEVEAFHRRWKHLLVPSSENRSTFGNTEFAWGDSFLPNI